MTRKIIVFFVVISLLIFLLAGCKKADVVKENLSEQERYVPVKVESVTKDTIYNTTVFSGKVYADKDVMIFSKIPGEVTNVFVKLGDKVKKGQNLFVLDKEDIEKQVEQAKVAFEGAKANYELTKEKFENAKITFERTKKLYEEGAVSKSQYEQAELAASDKSLEAAKSALNQAQVAYNQALEALENTIIKSPITGIVSSVNIETGEMTSNTQPAITVIDIDRVYVQIDVTENIINKLFKEQEVKVSIPSAFDTELIGKIKVISPAIDSRTQLYPVKIYVDNKDHMIKPGMLAQVKVDTDIKRDVVVVRSEAVVERNGEFFVFVVEGDKAVAKKVEIGLDTGMYVEIKKGLKEGEKIIVKGQNYVEDQMKVKIVRGE
ncbi:efflux RND transporter periplasmic adaptor subunit [Caloranaerobacter ferrireducens]|uniref:efflux RND transporter periplasmic adaptor subunit n=1 Tax=Caloranaerobacter ferrireducens TaxID=1323370 RepID=UPI0009F36210|nr:efflux RND transporter periplasmic adaptor subunit [Caloranaerobacter ferrireducens]